MRDATPLRMRVNVPYAAVAATVARRASTAATVDTFERGMCQFVVLIIIISRFEFNPDHPIDFFIRRAWCRDRCGPRVQDASAQV